MSHDDTYAFPPVIVHTARTLTSDEEHRIRNHASSIIIKGARSRERLLDEVTLFLHRVEAELPPDRRRMVETARDREAAFEGRRILVVDDDVRTVFALMNVLEARGSKVVVARNGREALSILDSQRDISVVLMDIMMPEMDGLEATRRIREDGRWSKLPIISLTAKTRREDQERCIAAGANDYISKPLDVDLLMSLLRVWMPR
jgi:CheY-like chemotaxis protein